MAGDIDQETINLYWARFNSRPRMAGDFNRQHLYGNHARFNSRPRMAGDARDCACAIRTGFQFTPAHGGRHLVARDLDRVLVSIHARAWRATPDRAGSQLAGEFQFTPAHGGRLPSIPCTPPCRGFNSRPRMAGDAFQFALHKLQRMFQFTPAHGGRQASGRLHPVGVVSIHARAWRATLDTFRHVGRYRFQFTPAHGGRRGNAAGAAGRVRVSIHARAWRATGGRRTFLRHSSVSIHARAWRATCATFCGGGARHVSIHARAWRATQAELDDHARLVVSIHARAWRATTRPDFIVVDDPQFQFTPAHGGRPFPVSRALLILVSIHARAWRATRIIDGNVRGNGFQFTPAHGGRRALPHVERPHLVSIHARAWRATGPPSARAVW